MATAKVLIVDDEILIARELESRLTNLGYDVPGIAASGKEAIRLVEETEPDLVLMDIVLKGDMDGIEAAAKIRKRRSVPVIYLTAYTDEATLKRARITEPFAYIVKPFSERELRANIEMALYKHEVEGRLRKVEKWFAASMERVAEGVVATDSQGVVAFLNREAEALTGWKSAEAVGQAAPEVLPLVSQAARTPVEGVVQRALAEGIVTYLGSEILLLNRAGEAVPVALTASCVRGGGGGHMMVVIVLRDLSEQRQVQQALRESEERFRLLVEQVKDYAIFMLDLEGNVTSWNSGAERIKGYRGEEIIGQHFAVFYTPEAVERGWPQHELEIAKAVGRFEDDGWRVRKDGSRFWANVVMTALRDEAGNLRGVSKIVRDLTERKRAEEELREKNEALVEADRRKDAFVAMLAHELRNPLAPLRNALHVLGQRGSADPAFRQSQGMMERQVRHLARIVDDLLDVSRIMRGKVQLRPERLDLARLVRTAVEDHRGIFQQAGLDLDVDLPELPVWVMGDSIRLAQVLSNLLQNAAKFTDAEGRASVRLAVDGAGQKAEVSVRDTGIGIGPDMLPRLFETFAQADRSLERSKGGLGLGLALVKGLTELHGGEVHAASAGAGCGAEFTVLLPIEPEPAALTEMPATPTRTGKRLRILVVEDHRDAADSLRMLLDLYGYEVTVAYTGPDGVRAAEQWQPDVVICDIGLPGLDGYGAARKVRQNPSTGKARLIAVTGYGAEDDKERSREAGFDAHLVKPVDPAALQGVLLQEASA